MRGINPIFVICGGLAVAVTLAGYRQVRDRPNQTIQAGTVTFQVVQYAYSAGTSQKPIFSSTEIIGIRPDGSTSRAIFHPSSPGQGTFFTINIADVSSGVYTSVDQLTRSTTTYRLPGMVAQFALSPGGACDGQRSQKILGFGTVFGQRISSIGSGSPHAVSITAKSWRAPDLGCLSLREEDVIRYLNGRTSLKVTSATEVRLGDPPAWLFDVPKDYTERSPSEVLEAVRNKRGEPPLRLSPNLDQAYEAARSGAPQRRP